MSDKFFIRDDQYNVKSRLFDSYDEAVKEVAKVQAKTPSGVACICREADYWFSAFDPRGGGRYVKESSTFEPIDAFMGNAPADYRFKAVLREKPVGDGVKDDRVAIQYPVKEPQKFCSICGKIAGGPNCHCEGRTDPINHPAHYTQGKIEPIDVIEDWGLGVCLGNCVKYIARAPHKGSALEDLRKAAWYLDREIWRLSAVVTWRIP